MKLRELSTKFETNAKLTSKRAEPVANAVNHLLQNTNDCIPYAVSNLVDELTVNGLIAPGKEGMCIAALTIQALIQEYKWKACTKWGFFCKGAGEANLKDVIDFAASYNHKYSLAAISESVQIVTGESPSLERLRKVMQRLVKAGRFARTERGVYKRVHKGI